MTHLLTAIHRFTREMQRADPVLQVLLKGHLLIEESLNRILEKYFFHPEYLHDARLRFADKVLLARGLCLRKHRLRQWDLISAINTLRNEVAHKLNSPERQEKLKRVKDIFSPKVPRD